MTRVALSSFRTVLFGRALILLFAMAGAVPLFVVTFSPSNFDWNGGPPPWYAPLLVLAVYVLILKVVAKVTRGLRSTWVDSERIYVAGWLTEDAFPLESITHAYVDRSTDYMGHHPIRVTVRDRDRTREFGFLKPDDLYVEDVEELLRHPIHDSEELPETNEPQLP